MPGVKCECQGSSRIPWQRQGNSKATKLHVVIMKSAIIDDEEVIGVGVAVVLPYCCIVTEIVVLQHLRSSENINPGGFFRSHISLDFGRQSENFNVNGIFHGTEFFQCILFVCNK